MFVYTHIFKCFRELGYNTSACEISLFAYWKGKFKIQITKHKCLKQLLFLFRCKFHNKYNSKSYSPDTWVCVWRVHAELEHALWLVVKHTPHQRALKLYLLVPSHLSNHKALKMKIKAPISGSLLRIPLELPDKAQQTDSWLWGLAPPAGQNSHFHRSYTSPGHMRKPKRLE